MCGLDALYGVALVVMHALLLAEVQEPSHASAPHYRRLQEEEELGEHVMGASPMMAPAAASHELGGGHPAGQPTGWFLQLCDLDFGWGHKMLGLPDQTLMAMGLIYGVVVLVVSTYMFQAVACNNTPRLPTESRFFTAFMHMQILIYVLISLVKLPKLCSPLQDTYLTHLYMECDVLWMVYIERIATVTIVFSFCTWIFSSFSFVLTFGHGATAGLDRPEFQQHLDLLGADAPPGYTSYSKPAGGAFGGTMARPPMSNAAMSRQSLAPVGPPVGVAGGFGANGRAPAGGGYPGSGASYNVGRMPRASSSMATTTTASHAEHYPLIKPPVAVY